MEKDHLPIVKVVKIYEINQILKLWARFPIAVSSCPTVAHMYRWNIQPSIDSSSRKTAKIKIKNIGNIQPLLFFTVCLNITFTDNWQNLRN